MRRHLWVKASALALLLVARPASGTIGPPVDVELLGPPRAAVPGEKFQGELRITSGVAASLKDIRLLGDGWETATVEAPQITSLEAGAPLAVKFEALCLDGDRPLPVLFEWNGQTIRTELDLSEKGVRYAREKIPVVVNPDLGDEPFPTSSDPLPEPGVRAADDRPDAPNAGPTTITVRVRGRFVYTRPDGVTLGVDGMSVEVYDEDPGLDNYITQRTTDSNGYFDFTFDFFDTWETYPDIYFEFATYNGQAEIEHPTWGYIYWWETDVTEDVTGYLNIGTIYSADESMQPALHLMTSMTRNWRWFHDYGYDPRYVEVEWPDGDEGAWYTPVSEEIHISSEHEWSDQVPTHEHGHHWMENYDPTPSPYYCNDLCDDSIVDCGHCLWCMEDQYIAWSEGLPDYLAYAVPMNYLSRYGTAASDTMWVQDLDICDDDPDGSGTYDPSHLTEGFVAAALVDIHDSDFDYHAPFLPWGDKLAIDSQEILACANSHNPETAYQFLFAFKDDYPAIVRNFWETAAASGFDVDEEDPAIPVTVVCNSHTSGVASPDATVDMEWSISSDDASGVEEYSWHFTHAAGLPDATVEDDRTSCSSSPLAPGTWYFSVRPKDRSGRWSPSYASWGPIVIREAEPANLTSHQRAGWTYPLVPTSSNTSSGATATVSATLPGYTNATWWNLSGQNDGESSTSSGFTGSVYYDDVYRGQASFGAVAGGMTTYTVNRGTINVPGGRHTFHGWFDSGEDLSETSEGDNVWGHQFVWTPYHLVAGTVRSQSSIENAFAGWENVIDGSTLWYNEWGLRFDNSGWWNACVVWAHDDDDNYDIRMHAASTGATSGFTNALTTSSLSGGKIDAVIVNRNVTATPEYDVGVYYTGVDADLGFDAVHLENDWADFDITTTTTLGPGAWLNLYEFDVSSDHVGPVTVFVWTDPVTPNVHIQWRAEDFLHGGLANCSGEALTGADGRAVFQFNVPETGMNNLCVYRHPKDGTTPANVSFQIRKTPPDLTPFCDAGWYAPLVPRPAMDGTIGSVPEPDTLHGNAAATYYNATTRNLTAASAESLHVRVWADATGYTSVLYPIFAGNGTSHYNFNVASTVRGGRHTLSQNIDPLNRIPEVSELNNVYGEQWVWSPWAMTLGLAVVRSAPPPIMGGWPYITTVAPKWYNCDGLRIPSTTGWWAAMATMSGDTSNVDVRLHQPLTGAKNGFAGNLAYSSWGAGGSDYVLVNFNLAPRKTYDVGVINVSGSQEYTAFAAQSAFLGYNPSGIFGPYSLGGYGIMRLHEMYLEAGRYEINLYNVAGSVNWGIGLHPNDEPYLMKSRVVPDGAAWMNGGGSGESITVTLATSDYYCLGVWKAKTSDLLQSGQYNLEIKHTVVAVPDGPPTPARTQLAGINPNPFSDQTTIHFDLNGPAAVSVAIYDLKGSRVRTMVAEKAAAGRYSVAWNGCDDRGRRLASGFYIVQMRAGEVRESRKIVMLR